jgi:tetratricopeptide (TPR) repeat protein
LGQLEPTQLLLQFPVFRQVQMDQLKTALTEAEQSTNGRIRFVAGVYAVGYPEASSGGNSDSQLPAIGSVKTRVDLARYAASPEATRDWRVVEVFNNSTAIAILYTLRQRREFKRGLADYFRFSQIGISSADIDNAAGLLASANGDLVAAETFYLKAIERAPDSNVVFRLNAIIIQMRQGNAQVAAQTADTVHRESMEKDYHNWPVGAAYFALALAQRAIDDPSEENLDNADLWIGRVLELTQSDVLKLRLMEQKDKLSASRETMTITAP